MKKIYVLLVALVGILAFPMQSSAQSCIDLYRQAESLRKSGKQSGKISDIADAISYYQRAMECDSYLRSDCERRIKECKKILPVLNIIDKETEKQIQEIVIPYQGGDRLISIDANNKWNVDGMTDWCNTETFDSKSFVVQCRETNNSTRQKINTLTIKSGSLYKTLKIIQEARPEYIDVAATQLSFPSDGTEQQLAIESNANWDVTSVPSWCSVVKDSIGIRIIVSPNDKVIERKDDIIIISPSHSVTITINQGAGNERLVLSQSEIRLNEEGETRYIRVYTDADNWSIKNYPEWMNVMRIGKDSIRIGCKKNIPNGEERSGSVQIETAHQMAGVFVTQSARMPIEVIFSDKDLIGGSKNSFGVTAGYYVPFVSASSGGDYVGSVLDYSLGTSEENAAYKSATGYTIGAFADIRLFKNIFLIAGVNFTQIKYQNEFNKTTEFTMPHTAYQYLKGNVQNSYTEKYSHTMLEVPILASYRFKIKEVSHVQLNFGPVLNFGLSANMNLSGNTDSESLKMYNSTTHQPVDNSNYLRHTSVNADFNLYQPCVLWTESYTTGNVADVQHHDKFIDSPLHRFNCGLRLGAAYEIAGLSFGLSYTMMLSNMANSGYWENKRWTILNESDAIMNGYNQRIHTLEFKLAYTLRYLKLKKK